MFVSELPRRFLMPLVAGALIVAGCAIEQESWPDLGDAEAQLHGAPISLRRAPDRFGGHKAQAEQPIRTALAEIEVAS